MVTSPTITEMAINDVVVKERKRPLGNVAKLSESIKELGLLNPITIDPHGVLIAGYHRLEACKQLGWVTIPVNMVTLDELNAELAEIDENLVRNELHWFDRDKQLARRKEIYEIKHPEIKNGGDRRSIIKQMVQPDPHNADLVAPFTVDAANKIGYSRDTIERSIQRANAFTEEQGDLLKKANVSATEATKIARLEEPARQVVLEKLVEKSEADEDEETDENIPEPTEEDHYLTAIDTGTLDYYYDDLRREAIQRDKEKRDNHVMKVMGSSESPEWYTPQEIIETVLRCLGTIDLDPCSNSHVSPTVPAGKRYTKEDDGLAHAWEGRVYMNPPYGSEIPAWTQKLVQEYKDGSVQEAIALLPARIDTQWFQPLYEYLICNVRGRIQFANSPYHAPFPCVVVYLGTKLSQFIDTFKNLGPIMRRIG